MAKIEIIIKDSRGKELTRLQSIDLELGSQSLDEIETAVEKLKKKMLPEISSELLSKAQREFTKEKKKTQTSVCNGTDIVKVKTIHGHDSRVRGLRKPQQGRESI